jgi:hypothetical protein
MTENTISQVLPDIVRPTPAPEIPGGWEAGPPDFVGVGTMRSGTSWWWYLLMQHPRFAKVNVRHKEIHFFDHYLEVTKIDPDEYYRYFPRQPGMVSGEWTPRYMYDYWTPPMLRQVAPGAKLLVLLRDPVDRYQSALAYTAERGYPASHAMLHHHFGRSLYGRQLANLLQYFPAEQVLVLQYEQCAADPAGQMRKTLEFIGLDPGEWRPQLPLVMRINQTKATKPDINSETVEALTVAFKLDALPVFDMFPGLDRSLWPSMR